MQRRRPSTITAVRSLVEQATRRGALAAEILQVEHLANRLTWREGDLQREREAGMSVHGRVWLEGGRLGTFHLETPTQQAIREAIDRALEEARQAEPDPLSGPADPRPIRNRGLGLYDVRYPHVDDDAREEVIQLNLEAVPAESGIRLDRIHLEDRHEERTFVSTRGVEAHVATTRYDVTVDGHDPATGLARRVPTAARYFSHVASLPVANVLVRRLPPLRERVAPPDGPVHVVLESRVLHHVIRWMAPAFTAHHAEAADTFPFRHEDPLAHRRFHLIDDRSLAGGLLSLPFDDRGVPPFPVAIVQEGRRGGVLHDPETARRAGAVPTGHAHLDGIRPSNLLLRAGNRSRTQMLSEVPWSVSFDDITGSLDLETGRLVFEGPGYVLARGRPRGAFHHGRVETDLVTLLRSIREIASDIERYLEVDCPTLVVEPLEVQWGDPA